MKAKQPRGKSSMQSSPGEECGERAGRAVSVCVECGRTDGGRAAVPVKGAGAGFCSLALAWHSRLACVVGHGPGRHGVRAADATRRHPVPFPPRRRLRALGFRRLLLRTRRVRPRLLGPSARLGTRQPRPAPCLFLRGGDTAESNRKGSGSVSWFGLAGAGPEFDGCRCSSVQ